MPAMPEPSPKVSASMRAVRMPIEAAIWRFCVTARISRPSRVKRSIASSADEHRQREHDDPHPVVGDGDAAELERAAHPRRIADLLVGRAERGAHRLLQDQRDAPGGEQRFQRAAVEEADDAALDQDADEARDQERERHRDEQRIVEQAGIAGADQVLHDEGRVGAEHHHLAMRHVDDAHHAERDGKADGGEQQHRAEREPVPGVLHGAPQREPVVDRRDRVGGGALHERGWPAGRPASSPRAS